MHATVQPPTPAQEWRAHWLVVASAFVALSLGGVPVATLGLFMEPLQAEFGWSRSEISAGMTIFALVTTPLTPFAGALVDRFGPRAVGMPGVGLVALAFAGFALLGPVLWTWFAAWTIYSLAALLIRTPVWSSAVSNVFVSARGLALAVVLCGFAMTTILAPVLTRWLIDAYGWRTAYLGVGFGWGGIAFALVLLFFDDGRSAKPKAQGPASALEPARLPGGLTLGQAIRNLPVQRIAFATFLQCLIGAAVSVHMFPLLTGDGMARASAALVIAAGGVGGVAGKLLTGWLMDRSTQSLAPAVCFALPGLGYLLLLQFPGQFLPAIFAVLVTGYGGGGALQVSIYLTTRYAGVRHFGKIFGVISSLMGLAGGLGPLLAGMIHDGRGSYTLLLALAVAAAGIAGLAVFRLGAYPRFEGERAA